MNVERRGEINFAGWLAPIFQIFQNRILGKRALQRLLNFNGKRIETSA